MFTHAELAVAGQHRCQDRVKVVRHAQGLVAMVADGAGGTSGGAEAAETAVMWMQAHVDRAADIRGAGQWVELLGHIDRQVSCAEGETTVVVVALFETGLCGASVGDSVAWLVAENEIDALTENQKRRPFVGTGKAEPVGYEREGFEGTLMLASDGLANYAERRKIVETLRTEDMALACEQLVNLVRLKSGALWDDVGIVLCRRGVAGEKCDMRETKAFVIE